MDIKKIEKNGQIVALIESAEKIISDTQSALDLLMTVNYDYECNKIAINKEAIVDDFFILSTCLAGEILQKFINYGAKFAIYGDFSMFSSKPLKDFIYESNNGNDIFFVATKDDAVEKLSMAK